MRAGRAMRPVLAEETVVVGATAEELAALHAALDRFWDVVDAVLAQPPPQDWRIRFVTAVAEVAANIVRHAYPIGTPRGPLRLRVRLYADRVVASFADRGVAFVPGEVQGPPGSDPAELPEGGFGLALARASLDRLEYRRTPTGTNCWRLTKRL
jgi:anti-sigma regulatory factor (Ser/Thr protein kinase)